MKLKQVSDNPNYLARLIRLPEPRKHSNADRLKCVSVLGNNLITGLNASEGDLVVYFPLECAISLDYLAHSNSLDKAELNRDGKTKGFFSSKHGRVKAISLRGERSEGYIAPASTIEEWSGYKFTEEDIDIDFDHIGELKLCEKYVNREQLRKENNAKNNAKKGGKVTRESRLVDNQFRLSPDYKHLKREIEKIDPDDLIEITSKWHGANGTIARVLTKRKLTIVDKIAKFFGANINKEVYDLVYASRRVIKNKYADQKTNDYYDSNVWAIVANRYAESLEDGITLVGEVVGYTPTGAGIQNMNGKTFDYGCEVGKCDFIVFRINYTNPSGKVFEFSFEQLMEYCKLHNLKHVPLYYSGKAKDKYPELSVDNHWHENLLKKLSEEYLEKDNIYCKTEGLPDEGVVVSKRVGVFEGYKLKSFRFVSGESEQLDTGEVNLDDDSETTEN